MDHIGYVLLAIGISGGLYWAWKYYQLGVIKHNAAHPPKPLFITPTIKNGGPAYNPNGEINWNSDEPIRSVGAKLAMLRESFGERHQCPKCRSRRWVVSQKDGKTVEDTIHCHDCQVVGTDNPELRKQATDGGVQVYRIADFDMAVPCE